MLHKGCTKVAQSVAQMRQSVVNTVNTLGFLNRASGVRIASGAP